MRVAWLYKLRLLPVQKTFITYSTRTVTVPAPNVLAAGIFQ